MTEAQAIAKASQKAQETEEDYIVVFDPCHSYYKAPHYYAIRKWEKHAWKDDEVLVFNTGASPEFLDVSHEDGDTIIRCDAITAARLAGRGIFGRLPETRKALEEAIKDSWYAADCPR